MDSCSTTSAWSPATFSETTRPTAGRSSSRIAPSETETGAVAGGVLGGAAGLTASLLGLAIPGLGPVIAVGPLIAMLTGAGAGAVAGGLIGALTEVGRYRKSTRATTRRRYVAAARSSRFEPTNRARSAPTEILREHGANDIEQRAMRWRDAGWRGWDRSAKPYTADEAERERQSLRNACRSD